MPFKIHGISNLIHNNLSLGSSIIKQHYSVSSTACVLRAEDRNDVKYDAPLIGEDHVFPIVDHESKLSQR